MEKIREASVTRKKEMAASHRKQIEKNERRILEIDTLFQKTYEDNVSGKLSDARFEQLSDTYELEQAGLKKQNEKIKAEFDLLTANSEKGGHLLELVRRYTDFPELTAPMLNEFINKVHVHQADKSSGERVQKVDIYLSTPGKFDAPDAVAPPTREELEALEKRLAKKRKQQEYFRRRYLEKKEEKARLAQLA